MPHHCSIVTCDETPTVKRQWRDEEDRRCFAWLCPAHALEAEAREANGLPGTTLDTIFPTLTKAKE